MQRRKRGETRYFFSFFVPQDCYDSEIAIALRTAFSWLSPSISIQNDSFTFESKRSITANVHKL